MWDRDEWAESAGQLSDVRARSKAANSGSGVFATRKAKRGKAANSPREPPPRVHSPARLSDTVCEITFWTAAALASDPRAHEIERGEAVLGEKPAPEFISLLVYVKLSALAGRGGREQNVKGRGKS